MTKNRNWFIGLFEESTLIRAIARFIALGGFLWVFIASVDKIRSSITPAVIHFTMSLIALTICVYSLNIILNKIYGKLGSEN